MIDLTKEQKSKILQDNINLAIEKVKKSVEEENRLTKLLEERGLIQCTECGESPTGKHKANLKTMSINWDEEGQAFYIDVNCQFCWSSGCIGKLTEDTEVDW